MPQDECIEIKSSYSLVLIHTCRKYLYISNPILIQNNLQSYLAAYTLNDISQITATESLCHRPDIFRCVNLSFFIPEKSLRNFACKPMVGLLDHISIWYRINLSEIRPLNITQVINTLKYNHVSTHFGPKQWHNWLRLHEWWLQKIAWPGLDSFHLIIIPMLICSLSPTFS